jgi:DNA-binding FadR family transcriptional regulator
MRNITLLDRVTGALARDILSGVHPAGEALPTEDEACCKFGVSRSVVREAVRQLAAKGMLTTHRRGGTRVTDRRSWNFLDPDLLSWTQEVEGVGSFLDKLFHFRMALEPAAAALAAEYHDPTAIRSMRDAFTAMTAARADFEAWIDADLRFHQAIYVGTGNELYWPVGELFANALRASFRVSSKNQHHQHCLPEHEAVLVAIERGRPTEARQATTTLLLGAEQDVDAVLSLGRSNVPAHDRADI